MCFSEKASIISFTVGIIGSLLCISLPTITDKIIGSFMGFVSLMQLVDFFIWRHQKCDDYNKILSFIGMALNHLQPIVLGIAILYFNNKTTHKKIIFLLLFLYLCIIIPYSLEFIQDKNNHCTLKNRKSKHLLWNWNNQNYASIVYPLFTIIMFLLFLFGFPNYKIGLCIGLISIITHIISAIFYPRNSIGTIWCYFTVFIPIIYYVLRITVLHL